MEWWLFRNSGEIKLVNNEELVEFYRDTKTKQNKNIIFNKIYNSLEKEAMKICHYYANSLSKNYKNDFFEEAMQEAKICLLKCIENFSIEKNVMFSTFYYKCLKNHIYNIRHDRFMSIVNEVTDDSVLNWSGDFEENNVENYVDSNILKEIFRKNIDNISFTKPIHKDIFVDYIGFGESGNSDETFASLSRKYLLSRMAIKKICDKYFIALKNVLKNSGDIEKIRIFL